MRVDARLTERTLENLAVHPPGEIHHWQWGSSMLEAAEFRHVLPEHILMAGPLQQLELTGRL